MAEPTQGNPPAAMSEQDLIARYFRPLARGFPGAFDLKDDAAVIASQPGCDLIVTTDALIADVHFFADDEPADIAYKALAVNVSDLAAKAAEPLAYSLALALPRATSQAWFRSFTEGLGEAQRDFAIHLSGGDMAVSPAGPLMISVTAFGTVPAGRTMERGAARAGDSLYVTGSIGDGALGLALRRSDAIAQGWPLSEVQKSWLIGRYLRPSPRLALRTALLGHASAALDISDGLVIDCARLCAAAGLDARLDAAAIPFSEAVKAIISAQPEQFEKAITGGDDYEILAAIRKGEESAFESAALEAGLAVTLLGSLAAGSGNVTIIGKDGLPLDVHCAGYDHFRQ